MRRDYFQCLKKWRGIVDYFQTFLAEMPDELTRRIQALGLNALNKLGSIPGASPPAFLAPQADRIRLETNSLFAYGDQKPIIR